MSTLAYRHGSNIDIYASSLNDFQFDNVINNQANLITNDDEIILIWYDKSINKDNIDDKCSFIELRNIIKFIRIFTEEEDCLEFIHKYRNKNKLFLIISGSLGRNFVPKIDHLSQIISISIFCRQVDYHQIWAKKYEKIHGVFDKTTELCHYLKHAKEKFEEKQISEKFIDSFSLDESNQTFDYKSSNYDDYRLKQVSTLPNNSFSRDEIALPINHIQMSDSLVHGSQTVTPYYQYKQLMEFSDNGIWPCVSVINNEQNEIINHFRAVVDTVKYFNSTENFLQHAESHPSDPQFIVILNPSNTRDIYGLIRPGVHKIYIYCFNNRLNEYDRWSERYPNIISVLQHMDTLTRLILWDLSACIVEIGNSYAKNNEKHLAQIRYRYAYRLHMSIQEDLNNHIQMIKFNQLS